MNGKQKTMILRGQTHKGTITMTSAYQELQPLDMSLCAPFDQA